MPKLWVAIRRYVRSLFLPKPPEGQRWVVFDDGRVAFLAPLAYAMHREQDETVAVYPPGDSGVTLRFSLHTQQLDPRMPADIAEQFVIEQALQKELSLTRLSDRIILTEIREGAGPYPDRKALYHYWQIGVGRILVVASATVWGEDRESSIVREALVTVPKIIESIRLT